MAFTIQDFEDLVRLMEEKPEWLERMRQLILTRELLQLPDLVRQIAESMQRQSEEFAAYRQLTEQRFAETDRRIAELTAAVQQLSEEFAAYRQLTEQRFAETDRRIAELTAAVQQLSEEFAAYRQLTDQRFAETNQQIADLVMVVRELVRRLERLEDWQRGETGRRDGERYERQVVARAPILFHGGSGGGMGEPHIRQQLGQWLASLYRQGIDIDEHEDPSLADLIWWKGDRVMVTEVSLKVDAEDVRRAAARARTLRQVGINATPTVIGREWATPDTQALAQQEDVEWMVGGGLSQGFLEFRRIGNGPEVAE
jgi:hypothetical protein